MRITKRQLRRIIKEEKAKVLAEQKVRHVVRTKLMEQMGGGIAALEAAIAGQDIELAMGGRGPGLVVNGQTLDMAAGGLDYALEDLWSNMSPASAYDWMKSRARSVQIDPGTAEDLGLWDHPDFM